MKLRKKKVSPLPEDVEFLLRERTVILDEKINQLAELVMAQSMVIKILMLKVGVDYETDN
jgi:hypothetical protein